MSKSNLQRTGYLKLTFQNINLANIGDATGLRGSTVAGSLFLALYTTDPTSADTGTEATYTSYARIAVVRSVAGWTVSSNVVTNAALVSFVTSTGGANTITHCGVRTALSGGDLVGSGILGTPLVVGVGDTPQIAIGGAQITEL